MVNPDMLPDPTSLLNPLFTTTLLVMIAATILFCLFSRLRPSLEVSKRRQTKEEEEDEDPDSLAESSSFYD